MASIEKRIGKDETTYRVKIRKKGVEIYKTFHLEEDAKLYAFYKERLIDNMESFDVRLNDRVTLEQLFELKIKKVNSFDKRILNDLQHSLKKISMFLPNKLYNQTTFEDWISCAKCIYKDPSFRGSKENIIQISPITLRRIFANASSVISHAVALGLELENYPLKVIQTFINPMIKKSSV